MISIIYNSFKKWVRFFSFYKTRHLLTFFKDKNNLLTSQNSIFQKNSIAKCNSNVQNFKISLQKLYLCIVSNYLSNVFFLNQPTTLLIILDRHYVWRSHDPTLGIWSPFVKKKPSSLLFSSSFFFSVFFLHLFFQLSDVLFFASFFQFASF